MYDTTQPAGYDRGVCGGARGAELGKKASGRQCLDGDKLPRIKKVGALLPISVPSCESAVAIHDWHEVGYVESVESHAE